MIDIYTQNEVIYAALNEWFISLIEPVIEESPNEYIRNCYKQLLGNIQTLAVDFKQKMAILPIIEFIHDQFFILDQTPEEIADKTCLPLKQIKSVIEVLMKPNLIPTQNGEV